MVGYDGRSLVLSWLRPGQSLRRWSTASYGKGQFRHRGRWVGVILFKWAFSCTCPVLRRKIVLWSHLFKYFVWSLRQGLLLSVNMERPVNPLAHRFIHFSLVLVFRICLVVLILQHLWCCGSDDPFFASLSAASLPGMLLCPGIHCRMMFLSKVTRKACIVSDVWRTSFVMFSFAFSNDSRDYLESEKMMTSVFSFSFVSNCWCMISTAVFIARISSAS